MQASIGAMFRATFNTSETLPLGDDGPDRSRSDRGSNVDVRLPVSAPWRSVTTDLPATLPLKATTPSAGAMMASCGRARKSNRDARQPLFSRRIIFADYLRVLQRPLH